MKRILLISVILVAMLLSACATQSSKPAMTFETIGTKGAIVLVTLVSPSPDAVSPEDLANRLRQDWKDSRFPGIAAGHVSVWVFDNKDAPQRFLEIWDLDMSDQEEAKEQARISPHWIAQYQKNPATGLHRVLFYDVEHNVIQTIKFQ